MPAKVSKVTTASLREAADHRKRVGKAQEASEVRAEVAEQQDSGQGPAFFRLVGRVCKNAVSRATAGPSGGDAHVYSEWLAGAKIAGINGYDRIITGGDPTHVAKLASSRDLDVAVRALTGGIGGIESPLLGLVLTAGSITSLHKLGNRVKDPVDGPAGSLEAVV